MKVALQFNAECGIMVGAGAPLGSDDHGLFDVDGWLGTDMLDTS